MVNWSSCDLQRKGGFQREPEQRASRKTFFVKGFSYRSPQCHIELGCQKLRDIFLVLSAYPKKKKPLQKLETDLIRFRPDASVSLAPSPRLVAMGDRGINGSSSGIHISDAHTPAGAAREGKRGRGRERGKKGRIAGRAACRACGTVVSSRRLMVL